MTNIASVLKAEIARVARKEVKAEVEGLKKANVQYRGAIADLRRQVAQLSKMLKDGQRQKLAVLKEQVSAADETPRRFSPTRLAAHRSKLGISAADYGRLVGMSGATIYLWEQSKGRPRPDQVKALAALKGLGRREVLARLATSPKP